MYTLSHILGERCLEVKTGKSFWQQRHCHSPHQSAVYHKCSRKWFPHQDWCRQHPFHSQFGQFEPRLTLTPRADIVWVFDKSLSYATARLVDHSMHCEHRMEFLSTPLQQTGQGYLPDFWRTSWSSPETSDLVFFMMRQSPLLSIPAFNALSLEMHSSWVWAMKTRSSV